MASRTARLSGIGVVLVLTIACSDGAEVPPDASLPSGPSITFSVTPRPNAAGWNNSPVTVRFDCIGPRVQNCSGPIAVNTEGLQQSVTGTLQTTDARRQQITALIDIDLSPPALVLQSEAVATKKSSYEIRFVAEDSLSGLARVTCDGLDAVDEGSEFRCVVALQDGLNEVEVVATDRADNQNRKRLAIVRSCPTTSVEELEARDISGWSATLDHAASLGYENLLDSQYCDSTGQVVLLMAGATEDDVLSLVHTDRHSLLVRPVEHGHLDLFSETGGVRLLAGGGAAELDSHGVPHGTAVPPGGQCLGFWPNLACRVAEFGISNPGCVAPIATCFRLPLKRWIAQCVAALSPQCADALAQLLALPSPVCGPSNQGESCDTGEFCTDNDACSWGVCSRGDPTHEGVDCSSAISGYPICQNNGGIVRPYCKNGRCIPTREPCPPGTTCLGPPNESRCGGCGDGTEDVNEQCDDGNRIDDDECTNECTDPICGDGIVQASVDERCDGSNLDGKTCEDFGFPTCTDGCAGLACNNECQFDFSGCSTCGDGITDKPPGGREWCDDMGESATCDADCSAAVCGDGTVNMTAGETCDDGNKQSGDGCSSNCEEEDGTGGGGGSWGDPHLITFDGLRYDFQGVGEYILVQTLDGSVQVQTRTAPARGWFRASLNQAVVVYLDGSRVGLYTDRDPRMEIDGVPTASTPGTMVLSNGASLDTIGNKHHLRSSSGIEVTVSDHGHYLNIAIFAPASLRGQLEGLLGNFDRNPGNDLVTREGAPVGPRPGLFEFYDVFGESWRVQDADSHFRYLAGNTTETHTNRRFPGSFLSLSSFSVAERATAEVICRGAGITSAPFLESCILDTANVGDDSFATPPLPLSFQTSMELGNYGLEFDGTDYLVFGSTSPLRVHTLEAWIKPAHNDNNSVIFGQMAGPTSFCTTGTGLTGNHQVLEYDLNPNGCGNSNRLTFSGDFENQWVHVAGSYDGSTQRLYVDGVLVAEQSTAGFGLSNWLMAGAIQFAGGNRIQALFKGQLDELRVWNVARTSQEIAEFMGRPLQGSESGLVGYWRLNDGSGQITRNLSPTGIDGVLGSSTAVDGRDPQWVESVAPVP